MQRPSLHHQDDLSSTAEKSQYGVNQVHENMKCRKKCIMYKIAGLLQFYVTDPQCATGKTFVVMFGI